tara:strand:+ start:43 stop:528 length:486 start_codon:yes stop_codon:yes gene_type:complete
MKNLLTRESNFRGILLITVLIITLYLSISMDGPSAQQVTQPLAVNLDELEWGPPGGGNGSPLGLRTARQGVDPKTGGQTYYAMFPAGSHFDLHWHTYDEHVVVVKGELTIELGDEVYELSTGSYIVIPGKLNHSWDVPEGGDEAVILVRRAGPADFHYVTD